MKCIEKECPYYTNSNQDNRCSVHYKSNRQISVSPKSGSSDQSIQFFRSISLSLTALPENVKNAIRQSAAHFKEKLVIPSATLNQLAQIIEVQRVKVLELGHEAGITNDFADQLSLIGHMESEVFGHETVDRLKNDKITDAVIEAADSNYILDVQYKSLESRDSFLQNRMRSLQWVTPYMLGIENFDDREFSKDAKFLESAISKIIELDVVLTPGEKLSRIIAATKLLLSTNSDTSSQFSADDLTPLIIIMIIRANPAMLLTNLFYIELFYDNNLLNTGETAFLYTQFSSAVRWLESSEADHSRNYRVTYEQFMAYKSTCAFPEEAIKRSPKVVERSLTDLEQSVAEIRKMLDSIK